MISRYSFYFKLYRPSYYNSFQTIEIRYVHKIKYLTLTPCKKLLLHDQGKYWPLLPFYGSSIGSPKGSRKKSKRYFRSSKKIPPKNVATKLEGVGGKKKLRLH